MSALRLELNDLPTAFADLRCSHRRHCAGRSEHRRGAWIYAVYFRRGRDECSLLDFGPGDVVNRESRHNIAIARNVDRLPTESNEGLNTAQLGRACRKELRAAALIECHVARSGPCGVVDESGRVLCVEFLQCERQDQ